MTRNFWLSTVLLGILLGGLCVYMVVRPTERRLRTQTADVAQAVGRVSFLEGFVEVSGSSSTWSRLKKGSRILPASTIRTGENGRVEVELVGTGGRMRLDLDGNLVLLGERRGDRWGASGGNLTKGSVWVEVTPRPNVPPFLIETPIANVVATGTTYRVHVLNPDSVRVSVYEGKVEAAFSEDVVSGEANVWRRNHPVSIGQAVVMIRGEEPKYEKVDLREDWSDGWHTVLKEVVIVEEKVDIGKLVIQDLKDINPDVYVSVELGVLEQGRKSAFEEAEEAVLRKIRIRSSAWDLLGPKRQVELLNETFQLLKQRYPKITRRVVLDFDDGRPELTLRYTEVPK